MVSQKEILESILSLCDDVRDNHLIKFGMLFPSPFGVLLP